MKKILIFTILALCLLPSLASAYVSISITSTTTPSTIEPGQNANLILTISNIGTSTAQNVKLKFKTNPSIIPTTGVFDLQSIPYGNSIQVTVPFMVSSDTSEGTTALQFTIDYNDAADPSGIKTQENSATISITKRTLIEISNVIYDEGIIQPGDTVNMNIELKNVGKGVIKDLSVSIYSDNAPFVPVEASNKFLNTLNPGEMKNVTFSIIINKDAKTIAQAIPLSLSYYDDFNILHTDTKHFGLKISGKPDFVVSVEKTTNMYSGTTGTMSVSVANRGTATAQFLTARFDSGFDVTPSENYIGNLDPDDTSTVSLDVSLKGVSVGKHSLNMTLFYKDPYNKDFSETRTLQFDVTSVPIEISNVQIAIVIVIIGILYWKRSFIKGLIKRK